jgi:hypothetical protein
MVKKFAEMSADELKNMISYMAAHDTGSTVGRVKKELNLTEEEYQELYELSLPAIRYRNGEWYWKARYNRTANNIRILIENFRKGHALDAGKAIGRIAEMLEAKSLYDKPLESDKEGVA